MSSPEPFQYSSPISTISSRRQKSRYTYRNLTQLAQSASNCPLRVIAHVDLDAFYAQCEMVRLNVPESQPLAVQQWQGLIAINYPARKFGLNRHITVTEAKNLCPNLITQHVPTWKEGHEKWAYHEDASKNMDTHKVSLDPYRLESRRILTCIKETLSTEFLKIEKASVDEFFLDLSAQVHSILLRQYPDLSRPPPYDDLTELLPSPPSTILEWGINVLIDVNDEETEYDDPDWDDITLLIGSKIICDIRANILKQLKYTCSAGIAQNKMLAKLGSSYKKPNHQTVLRKRDVERFLLLIKFTKIRGLGGKLGEQITTMFKADTVEQLLSESLQQLKLKLGDDTGIWVYETIRGIDHSEVNPRTQIKSMLSAKSFRPSINTSEQATRWLCIFAADIHSRLIEENMFESKRRPKTMSLHYRQGIQNRSRSCTISCGKRSDEIGLFEMAKNLLDHVVADNQIWPCTNLSLSIGGFEDGIMGNMNIGSFLIKGSDAKTNFDQNSMPEYIEDDCPIKRRRLETSNNIQNYFEQKNSTNFKNKLFIPNLCDIQKKIEIDDDPENKNSTKPILTRTLDFQTRSCDKISCQFEKETEFYCVRCKMSLSHPDSRQTHEDWHIARDLQDSGYKRVLSSDRSLSLCPNKKALTKSNQRKNAGRKKGDQTQTLLKFG